MEQLEIRDQENLLAEIRAELMKQNAQEKERGIYQKLTFFSLLALVIVIVGALLLCIQPLQHTLTNVNETLNMVQQAQVNETLLSIQNFANQGTESFSALENTVVESMQVLEGLDVETLNAAIQKLNVASEGLVELDFETLNTAITNLNATIEPLAKFLGVFKKN